MDATPNNQVPLIFPCNGKTPRIHRSAWIAPGAVIIGVSADELADQVKFAEKNDLGYPLLSDADAKVCEKYGVWQEKSMYGRKFMGIVRSTYVIDKAGKIAKAWPKVKVTGHAEEVLEFVKGLK